MEPGLPRRHRWRHPRQIPRPRRRNRPPRLPSSDEIVVNKYNGRYNNFLNGTITWSGQTGARVLYLGVRDEWAARGREDGELGYPKTDEQVAPDGIGHYVAFENKGSIYSHPSLGRGLYRWKSSERGLFSVTKPVN
ncbi:LGFP repeat-containing protein [Rhodococcus ruber]|uniref:LGFP repeat-containing protein n=1 Tax=Rhodococcus ruber TaxID=1830 RepID=UPI003B75BDD7